MLTLEVLNEIRVAVESDGFMPYLGLKCLLPACHVGNLNAFGTVSIFLFWEFQTQLKQFSIERLKLSLIDECFFESTLLVCFCCSS